MNRVSAEDAQKAMIFKDGILDFEAHDRALEGMGYAYLASLCNCDWSYENGHMPCCGWGKQPVRR